MKNVGPQKKKKKTHQSLHIEEIKGYISQCFFFFSEPLLDIMCLFTVMWLTHRFPLARVNLFILEGTGSLSPVSDFKMQQIQFPTKLKAGFRLKSLTNLPPEPLLMCQQSLDRQNRYLLLSPFIQTLFKFKKTFLWFQWIPIKNNDSSLS